MNLITKALARATAVVLFSTTSLFSFATVYPPSSPTCSSGNFLWQNAVSINGCTVNTNLRFIDGQTTRYTIPNLPADFSGNVTIEVSEAVSWDGYCSRNNVSQYYEQWKVVFLKNGSVVYETPYTGDVADRQYSAEWKGSLGSSQTFATGVDQIVLAHYEDPIYGTGSVSSANSVVPTSVCFKYTVNNDGGSGCTPTTSNPCIKVLGKGAYNCSSKTLTASGINSSDIDKVELQLLWKGARPTSGKFTVGSTQSNFSTSFANSYDNQSSYSYEGYYSKTFNNPSSNSFKYDAWNEQDELVSFIAYVHLDESVCADNNTQLKDDVFDIYKSTHTVNYTIPVTTGAKTIELVSPISELTNDSRIAQVTLTAGSQSEVWTENTYEGSTPSIAFAELKLENVPGSVTSVSIEYKSPNSGGDSYYNGQGVINWYEECSGEVYDWCGKKRVCTNPNKVSGNSNLSDFQIYIEYSNNQLKTSLNGGKVQNNDGFDIIFTDLNGGLLDFQVQEYSATNGSIKSWVKIPNLDYNDSTCFLLQYGAEDIETSLESEETWSDDYRAVYHFENYTDATNYNNDGTNNGASLSNAVMGKGVCLDGNNDFVNVGDDNSLDWGGKQITMSAWVKINTPHSVDAAIAVKGNNTNDEYYMFGIDGGTTSNNINTRVTTNNGHYRHDQGTMPDNQWALFTFVYNGDLGSDQKTSYINGVEVADQSATGNLKTGSGPLLIGKRTDGRFLKGCIDELRISSEAKSADWIKTEYNNQNNPSSFVTITNDQTCFVVPVNMISFTGEKVGEDAVLTWSTATEVNNDRFEIERRFAGQKEYTYVGTVDGNGTSNNINHYTFVDITNPWNTDVTYYRLKQIDFDGKFEYHGDVALTTSNEVQVNIYPNPTMDKTTVTLASSTRNDQAIIQIYDLFGRNVTSDAVLEQRGESVAIDVSSLRNGSYVVRIESNGQIISQRLSVAR
jgi:hypothetical protein